MFYIFFYIAFYILLNIDRVISKVEVRKGREAGTIHRWFTGVFLLSYVCWPWKFESSVDWGAEESSIQLITTLSAAIFVFVGVDSNYFRYVWDIKVVEQGLVGDVPGGTADRSEHFW